LTLGLAGLTLTSFAFAMDVMENKTEEKMMMKKCIDMKKATKMEIKKFQVANHIRATGFVGPITKAKLTKNGCMKMVMSTKDIVDTAVATESLSTLVAAVKAADLVTTLKTAGPFTVFAPTNAAFAKLPAGTVEGLLKPEKKADLASVLTYHVVAGKYTADKITDGLSLKTVNGKDLKFTIRDGKVMINGNVMVQAANVETSNGVVHVIDGVLLP
jgi:uncharacterized surface protein with fasciclin (FAS1) repeats